MRRQRRRLGAFFFHGNRSAPAGVGPAEIPIGRPADIDVAGSVHGYRPAVIPITRPELGRPYLVTVRVELVKEPIVIAGVGPIEIAFGIPGDIGIAQSKAIEALAIERQALMAL